MQKFSQFFYSTTILILSLIGTNCASTPEQKPIFTPEERVQIDNRRGALISVEFEKSLSLRSSVSVTMGLREIAIKVAQSTPLLRESPVGVLLVSERKQSAAHRSYAIPGIRLYLSVATLRQLKTENEAAALIAWQLAHIWKRHAMSNLESLRDTQAKLRRMPNLSFEEVSFNFLGPQGVLTFNEKQLTEALEAAVELLYLSGYDSRGLVSLLQTVQSGSEALGVFASQASMERVMERVRLKIMSLSPLRFPVVDTPAFSILLKKIRQL